MSPKDLIQIAIVQYGCDFKKIARVIKSAISLKTRVYSEETKLNRIDVINSFDNRFPRLDKLLQQFPKNYSKIIDEQAIYLWDGQLESDFILIYIDYRDSSTLTVGILSYSQKDTEDFIEVFK